MFYAERVLAHENLFEVLNSADHCLLAAGQSGLAHAEDPFVGVNDDEEKVAMAGPNWIGGNVGNLHLFLLEDGFELCFSLYARKAPGTRANRGGVENSSRQPFRQSQRTVKSDLTRDWLRLPFTAKPTPVRRSSQAVRPRSGR